MSEEPRTPNPYGAPGEPPLPNMFRPPPGGRGDLREKGWVPAHRFALWWFLMLLGYYFLPEWLWEGRSFGKWAFGLRVVRLDGAPADMLAITIRTLLRLIDFVPGLYLTGFLVRWITGPAKRQRLGDLAADTTVVVAPFGSSRHTATPTRSPSIRLSSRRGSRRTAVSTRSRV